MLQAQKEAAEDAQREAARSMKDVKIAQEITKQVQEEMSSKLQMAAAERETLLQRLQAVQHSAQPSAEDVSDLSQSHLQPRSDVWGYRPDSCWIQCSGLHSAPQQGGSLDNITLMCCDADGFRGESCSCG